MSVFTHSALLTAGGAGRASGWNDHHARCSAVMTGDAGAAARGFAAPALSSGQGAPCLIHSTNAAIVASGSFVFFFGIRGNPSSRRMA